VLGPVTRRFGRPRVAAFLAGVAVVALGLGPEVAWQIAAARDDRTITKVAKGCGTLPDAAVARWLPGAKAQPELPELDELSCRWRAADPTRHNATVRLIVHLPNGATGIPADGPKETADDVAHRLLYTGSAGPGLALAPEPGGSGAGPPARDVRFAGIGDEALTTVERRSNRRSAEVVVTVHVRRANAVIRLTYHAYDMREATVVGAAQTLAREAVNRL
jgi:hypothetical protein